MVIYAGYVELEHVASSTVSDELAQTPENGKCNLTLVMMH